MKTCEKCGVDIDGKYGSGRFCCKSCANSRVHTIEIKNKISKSLKKCTSELKCEYCQKTFYRPKKPKQRFCSNLCAVNWRWKNTEYREQMSKISKKTALNRHKNGDPSFGWKNRDKLVPSYIEQIAIDYFNRIGFTDYKREHPAGKYFIDFAILSHMIAIELDGQQHNKPERIESDRKKDLYLTQNGWTVFRIKYPSQNIIKELSTCISSL